MIFKRKKAQEATKKSPSLLTELAVVKEYTFERFAVKESNKFAYESAYEVAKAHGKAYNPLLIYGPIGMGKTHLVNAIANYVLKNKLAQKIYYTTPEDFGAKLGVPEDTEILIMEDIQFIGANEEVQEKFFYAFNALYQSRRQIILTSDRPPKDIARLQDRLRSRFESGLMANIKPPELGLRAVILRRHAREKNIELPDEVVHIIALKVESNIRDLIASLDKVITYAVSQEKKLTPELTREALGEHIHFAGITDEEIKEIKKKSDLFKGLDELPMERELKEGMEKRIEKCKTKIADVESKGKKITIPERMLRLAVLHLESGNYEYATKHLKKAEHNLEEIICGKVEEERMPEVVEGVIGVCFGCGKRVEGIALKCKCGTLYHDECIRKLESCLSCLVDWSGEF